LGYHLQTNNKASFLSLDFRLREFEPHERHAGAISDKERLNHYRGFVYAKGGIHDTEGTTEQNITTIDRFRCRTRYFADSGVIGSKEFVGRLYAVFKGHFSAKHEKKGKAISGLEGIYSLKRLYGEG
jgi:putative transposase